MPAPIIAAVAAAWGAAVAVETSGIAGSLHHDSLLEGGPGFGPVLLLFLAGWQVMVAAMMLPSSLPLVRMFAACLRACRHPASFLRRHYRRGTRGAFSLEAKHGLFCVGCCWALMLLRKRTWRSRYGVLTVRACDTLFRARLQAWMDCLQETWLHSADNGA